MPGAWSWPAPQRRPAWLSSLEAGGDILSLTQGT